MSIDIGNCISYGIEKFKNNMSFYIVGFLIIIGGSIGITAIAQPIGIFIGFVIGAAGAMIHLSPNLTDIIAIGAGYLTGAILQLLIAPLLAGYYKGIRKEYEGKTASVSDVFSAFDIAFPCLLNYAVANLIIAAGFICCIIPGILLLPLTNMSLFFLVKDDIQGLNPIRRSWETLKKKPIIILWYIVLELISSIGFMACCVGILVTAPIVMCAKYKLFQQAIGEDNLPASETPAQN